MKPKPWDAVTERRNRWTRKSQLKPTSGKGKWDQSEMMFAASLLDPVALKPDTQSLNEHVSR